MEKLIEVEVEMEMIALPANWHLAKECRKIAESWENEEINNCINFVMDQIYETALKGGTTLRTRIKSGRPEHFYVTFKKLMKNMGYVVDSPSSPASGSDSLWKISW